jgi:hypothetical protein
MSSVVISHRSRLVFSVFFFLFLRCTCVFFPVFRSSPAVMFSLSPLTKESQDSFGGAPSFDVFFFGESLSTRNHTLISRSPFFLGFT